MRVLPHHLQAQVGGLAALQDGVRRPADQHLQVGRGERLGQVVPGAHPERLDARRHARIAGHHDHQAVAIRFQGGIQEVEPRHLRHEEVDQHQVELPAPHQLQRLLAPPRQRHGVSLAAQHRRAALPQGALVVDDQDPDRRLDVCRKRQGVPRGRRLLGADIRPPPPPPTLGFFLVKRERNNQPSLWRGKRGQKVGGGFLGSPTRRPFPLLLGRGGVGITPFLLPQPNKNGKTNSGLPRRGAVSCLHNWRQNLLDYTGSWLSPTQVS